MRKNVAGTLIMFAIVAAFLWLGPLATVALLVTGAAIGGLAYGVWFNIHQNRRQRHQEPRDEG